MNMVLKNGKLYPYMKIIKTPHIWKVECLNFVEINAPWGGDMALLIIQFKIIVKNKFIEQKTIQLHAKVKELRFFYWMVLLLK